MWSRFPTRATHCYGNCAARRITKARVGMPVCSEARIPKPVKPTEQAKKNELALRKAVRANANCNIQLDEIMRVVRNNQTAFDRQCSRIDRSARNSHGGKAQMRIRGNMLMRQQILKAQWEQAQQKPLTTFRRKESRKAEAPEDCEPTNNPGMVLGHGTGGKTGGHNDHGGCMPRFMDSIKATSGFDVPLEDRAVLLAMGAGPPPGAPGGTGDDGGEEVAVATFNPPHWTSLMSKQWLVAEKRGADAQGRPHTARADGWREHDARGAKTERGPVAHAAPRHALHRPVGERGAEQASRVASWSARGRVGTRAGVSDPADELFTVGLNLDQAEEVSVDAARALHHSIRPVFEETPMSFHAPVLGLARTTLSETTNEPPSHLEGPTLIASMQDQSTSTPNLEDTSQDDMPPHDSPRKAKEELELGGPRLPADSVVLPTKAKTSQLYARTITRSSQQQGTDCNATYTPQNRWRPRSAIGKYHSFLDNINLRPASSSGSWLAASSQQNCNSVRSYLQASSRPQTAGSLASPTITAEARAFRAITPRSNASLSRTGVASRSTAGRPVNIHFNLPSNQLNAGGLAQGANFAPCTMDITPDHALGRSVIDKEDSLVEESRRILDRLERQACAQPLHDSIAGGNEGSTKVFVPHTPENMGRVGVVGGGLTPWGGVGSGGLDREASVRKSQSDAGEP